MQRLGILLGKLYCRIKNFKFGHQNFLFTVLFLLIILVIVSFQNQKKINSLINHQSTELNSLTESLNSLKNIPSNNLLVVSPTIPEINPIITVTISPPVPTPTVQVLGDNTTQPSNYLGLLQVKEGVIANIHQNPSIDSIILTTVPSKSFLFYTERGTNWYKVDLADSNQTGWVQQENINEFINE